MQGQDPVLDQKKAASAVQFEMSQIGKDCPDAKTTLKGNSCLIAVEENTQKNFHQFYDALRHLLASDLDAARQLDDSQAQWDKYLASACNAVDAFYRSGTIRTWAVTACRIQITRSRMRDLDALYSTTLHN
jgi:uncharacterized protein YecT (DUF1311 family)